MRFLFLFLDGVGLGPDDPATNPFTLADMPAVNSLLAGRRLVSQALPADGSSLAKVETSRASLLALDACLDVAGLPQSASGQATLLTGINVPKEIGYHYGPKPNPAVAKFLRADNLFHFFQRTGRRASLLNAYPPNYFAAINSGLRIYSAIPLAVTSAGLLLKSQQDLFAGEAISADLTGQGWRERLGLPDTPILSPQQAGERLSILAGEYDFSFFEYWLSDYVGHSQDLQAARNLLETFDQVLAGLAANWDDNRGLILLTSDHGNLEDLS
ncbi:MAG TPA: hypothetical protein VJ436_04575, partial [Anaerolineales bacterium]|nr:hypothetical protein [Anaerolineales bacterium]